MSSFGRKKGIRLMRRVASCDVPKRDNPPAGLPVRRLRVGKLDSAASPSRDLWERRASSFPPKSAEFRRQNGGSLQSTRARSGLHTGDLNTRGRMNRHGCVVQTVVGAQIPHRCSVDDCQREI